MHQTMREKAPKKKQKHLPSGVDGRWVFFPKSWILRIVLGAENIRAGGGCILFMHTYSSILSDNRIIWSCYDDQRQI